MDADPRSGDQDRADYLRAVSKQLWPAPAQVTLGRARPAPAGPGDSELIVLPGLRRPRLIVPRGRRPSAAAVRGYGEPGSARAQLAARALAAGLGSGLGAMLLRDRLVVRVPPGAQTIESHLSAVLDCPIAVSMHLGAARANRKPVLQLLTPSGSTVGYAKIGISQLTTDLIRAETDALERLTAAGLTGIQVPRVLSSGSWQDLEVLVLSPLPVWQRRKPLAARQLATAMAELARSSDVQMTPLTASQYWECLTTRLETAADGPERDALRAALAQLASDAGHSVLGFGAWHGDWTPWNMANTPAGLLVWDWERYGAGSPLGFDALHYWLQAQVVPGRGDPAQAAASCVERSPGLLEPFGVAESAQARLTALLYLADLSVRYLVDRQEQAGARLGAPGRWLIPAMTGALSRT